VMNDMRNFLYQQPSTHDTFTPRRAYNLF